MRQNNFGLSRDIPDLVRLKVRQRCGFGCVICGSSIVVYEHFKPPFRHARSHDPEGITLLCPTHHDQKERRRLSLQAVSSANDSPAALTKGFAHEVLDLGTSWPRVRLGSLSIERTPVLVEVHEQPLIAVRPSVDEGPFLLDAVIYDETGHLIARIAGNEWRGDARLFDMEFSGPSIRIRNSQRNIVLEVHLDPPDGIVFEKLSMFVAGVHVGASRGEYVDFQICDGPRLVVRDGWVVDAQVAVTLGPHGLVIGRGGSMGIGEMLLNPVGSPSPLSRDSAWPDSEMSYTLRDASRRAAAEWAARRGRQS